MKLLKNLTLIIGLFFGIQTGFSQCQADFTFVNNGNGNVSFTNTSTGTIAFTNYDFGDGNNNWLTNPNYTYSTPGTYYVCLTAGDSAAGCFSTFCDSVVILSINNCNAFFTANFTSNNTISFNNFSSGNITSYSWSFGDGNISSAFQPTNTYASVGSYYVCLTVSDAISGCNSTFCDSITILPPGNCNANFTYVDNGNGNVTFTNTSTGTYPLWSWDFGAGFWNQYDLNPTPSYSFPTNGSYNVCLYVSDSATGCYSTFCDTINIDCFSSFYGYLDSIGPFDVIVVNNAVGNNLTYLWDFGDGNTSTQQFPQYTYATQGNYYLCLTVDDGNGCIDMFCDSINASGINKQPGFTINIIGPNPTAVNDLKTISLVKIYPNPAKNEINFSSSNFSKLVGVIKIYDLNGRLIYNERFKPKINISNLPKGLYFLKLETSDGEILNYKLIKD